MNIYNDVGESAYTTYFTIDRFDIMHVVYIILNV